MKCEKVKTFFKKFLLSPQIPILLQLAQSSVLRQDSSLRQASGEAETVEFFEYGD